MPKGKNKTRFNFGYGAIYQRKTKKGKIRWYIDYRDAVGKRIQKLSPQAANRDEAFIALQEEIRREFNQEYRIKRQKEKVRFPCLADTYLENYAKSNKKSWKTDRSYVAGMKTFIGNIFLDELTTLQIEKYKSARLAQGVKASTVNRCLSILRRMLNLAVEWEYLDKAKIPNIKLFPEKDNIMERILTWEEEPKLLEECPDYLRPILIVALNTGMRLGEILSLNWEQIDFESRLIRVDKTKSGRRRYIPVNEELLSELIRLETTNGEKGYLFINPETGKPFTTLKKSYKSACARAGVTNLRFHDLRHYAEFRTMPS